MKTFKARGYKCKLGTGKKLSAEINERGWTVKIQGENGDWKPGVHSKDPVWEDARKWEGLPEMLGIDKVEWNHFRASVEQQENEVAKPKTDNEDKPDEVIAEKAKEILRTGDPIDYIIKSCGRYVLGGENAFHKLICCIAVQDIRQSAGLHPRLSGESGMGKSLVTLVFAHHLPPEIVSVGSSSNLAVFYHDEGNRVFRILDDYLAGGNETIDTIIKQTSTVYHQVYAHKTVRDMEPATLYIGSEQTWAITAVDASQDIQVLNRQIPINVDDSVELTAKVNTGTIARYTNGQEQFFMDETVQICREMWRILRAEGYVNVKVPFGDRIEWIDNSNRRNPSIFMDLVVAHTAMLRLQRERDAQGCYLSIEKDFHSAEDLFKDKDAEELVKRLTKKERELAETVSKHKTGISREEVASKMKISVARISQLIHGEKGKGGLMSKLPGLVIEDTTDTERDESGSKSIRRQVLKLTGYIALEGFDRVVQLKEVKDGLRDDLRNVQNKEISNTERDERERDREFKDITEREKKEFSSLENKNISFLLPEKSLNSLNDGDALRNDILKSGLTGPSDDEILLKALNSIRSNHGRLTPFYLSMAAKHFGGDIPPKESEVWMRNVGCVEAVPSWISPDVSQ